jgi:hypothetical protein
MADKKIKINELPKAKSLANDDLFVVEQKVNGSMVTRSTTLKLLGDTIGGGGGGGGGATSADKISYDNSISELEATNVQTAIDVLAEKLRDYSGIGFASLEVNLQSATIDEVKEVPETEQGG